MYIVTIVFQQNYIIKMKTDGLIWCIRPSGNKKSGAVFLYFDNFYSLIFKLADNIIIYLSFVIIYDNLLKYVAVTTHFFISMKIVHNANLSSLDNIIWMQFLARTYVIYVILFNKFSHVSVIELHGFSLFR